MKQLKKALAVLLAMVLVFGLAACGKTPEPAESTASVAATEESASVEESSEASAASQESAQPTGELNDTSLYLVTDLGTIDDKSFNQGSFEGLQKLAGELGLKANYLKPAGEGDQIYLQAVEQTIADGAKVVVTPGFLFIGAVGTAQSKYPDVKFIAVDFAPSVDGETVINNNTVSIIYHEEQAGFLAGYAAVKDGYTKLGFMGGVAVPAVIRYGFGFAAGANYAAKELGTKVELKYNYTGSFTEKPEIQTAAASWYQNGTEVIFSCGGGIAASVLKAAQENNGKMIGVDVDQKDMGEQVITSAMKNLSNSVYEASKSVTDGTFPGGQQLNLGVKENGVQLSDDFSRFTKFTEDDYKAIYEKLVNNVDGLTDSIPVINTELGENEQADPSLLQGLDNIAIEYIK